MKKLHRLTYLLCLFPVIGLSQSSFSDEEIRNAFVHFSREKYEGPFLKR